MPISNLELHNSNNSWECGYGLINLFPHCTRRTNGFHFLLDFTCAASHNSPFTSNTNKWWALSTIIFIGNGILEAPPSKLELTLDGPSLGPLLPYSTTFWVCVLDRVCLSKLTKLSSYPNDWLVCTTTTTSFSYLSLLVNTSHGVTTVAITTKAEPWNPWYSYCFFFFFHGPLCCVLVMQSYH